MTGLLNIVDSSPTLYLLAVAWLLYLLGNATRMRVPILSAWQEALAACTFVSLALRRLVWAPPTHPADVIVVLMRAAAFGVVVFGLSGTLGVAWLTLWRSIERIRYAVRVKIAGWRHAREQKRREEYTIPTAAPTARELERDQREQEQREREVRQRETDRQRRLELKLQAELEMEFAADQNRREKLNEFITTYADESLPVEVYEQRLATIRDAVVRHAPARAKQYRSMQDIIDDFEQQLADVEQSTQSEFEKESLRSLILGERQNAIQRFIQQ